MLSIKQSCKRNTFVVLYGTVMTVVVMTALYVDTSSLGAELVRPDVISILFWGTIYGSLMLIAYRTSEPSGEVIKKLSDVCAVLGVLAFSITLVTTNLIAALLLIIKWALAALLVTLPGVRPLYFILAAAVTLVATAASQAKSTGFLFFIILFALLAICVLILVHQQRLLDGGTTEDSDSVRRPLIVRLITPALMVILPVVAMASATYFLVPRPDAFNLGRSLSAEGELYENSDWEKEAENAPPPPPQEGPEGEEEPGDGEISESLQQQETDIPSDYPRYTDDEMRYGGFSQSFDISQTAEQTSANGNPIVFYVRSEQPIYLKARIFDHFDGSRWTATLNIERKRLLEYGELVLTEDDAEIAEEQIVEVEVEVDLSDEVPLADRVSRLRFPSTVLSVDPRGLVRAPSALKRGTAYSFSHHPVYYQRRPTSKPLEPAKLTLNKQLPEQFDPAILDLALEVTRGKTSFYDRALAIEAHLQTEYAYSLQSAFESQNFTPLSDFLFNTKSGHCEYFASAMAMMLRSIEIPARLVTGFAVHHYNPLTGLYEVRALHGHAWVEAWIEDAGWVSFQPTPGYTMPQEPEEEASRGTTGEELDRYLDQLASLEQVIAPEDIPARILTRSYELAKQISQIASRIGRSIKTWIIGQLSLLIVLLALLGALFVGYRHFRQDLKRYWIRKRFAKLQDAGGHAFWVGSYRLLDRWFASFGFPRQPWMTLEEYVSDLPIEASKRRRLEQDYVLGANRHFYSMEHEDKSTDVESGRERAYASLKRIFER